MKKVIDALQGVTEYGYDDRGNRTSVKDANGTTTLVRLRHGEPARVGAEPDPGRRAGDDVRVRRRREPTLQDGRERPSDGVRRTTRTGGSQAVLFADGTRYDFDYDARGNRTLEKSADARARARLRRGRATGTGRGPDARAGDRVRVRRGGPAAADVARYGGDGPVPLGRRWDGSSRRWTRRARRRGSGTTRRAGGRARAYGNGTRATYGYDRGGAGAVDRVPRPERARCRRRSGTATTRRGIGRERRSRTGRRRSTGTTR